MFVLSLVQTPSATGLHAVNGPEGHRLTAVNQELDYIRRAVSDCAYTMEALATELGKSRQYVHAVLSGDKPITFEFFASLPDDVKARLIELRGADYGFVVVRPAVGPDAIRSFVAGLVGLLTGKQAA